MENIGCECTDKSIKNLEQAIKLLLKRGRKVNNIMGAPAGKGQKGGEEDEASVVVVDDISAVRDDTPRSSLEKYQSKICKPPSPIKMPIPKEQQTLYNKKTKASENIDFEIPSLTEEPDTSDQKSKKTITTATLTKTTRSVKVRTPKGITLNDTYTVDIDGKSEQWPARINFVQQTDGSLNVSYSFLDLQNVETMTLKFNLANGNINNIVVDGKQFRQVDTSN